jgi:hypothetical protein
MDRSSAKADPAGILLTAHLSVSSSVDDISGHRDIDRVADFQKQIDQIRYFVDGSFELPNRDRQMALLEAQQAKLFADPSPSQ